MEVERKYGVATTILFPLIDFGATDFEATPVTFASGDTQISKDEGAFANTTNNPAHEGNGIYSLSLSATEMQAARIAITVIDQTATKEWEDQSIIIATYGNASAQHAFDRDLENGGPQKNTALSDIPFYMVDDTDGKTPETGLTVTAEVSKDGAAFASAAGTVTEISDGVYHFDATAADMNADVVLFKFTATGARAFLVAFQTVE